jgi:ABC-type amino acid transport substrate-binding protein
MRILRLLISLVFFSVCLVHVAAASPSASQPNLSMYPPSIAAIKKSGVLRVAMFASGAKPFFMQDATGQWSGIDIDLDQMAAAALGVKLVIVPVPTYDDVILAVAAGKADLGEGLLNVTPARALLVKFSDGTYSYHPSIFVNRVQMNQLGWNITNLVTHLQVTQQVLKIGVLDSFANISLVQSFAPAAKIITFPSQDAVFEAVSNGEIFAGMSDTPEEMNDWLNMHPHAALTGAQAVVMTRSILFGVAISWKTEGLREWMNVFINSLDSMHVRERLFEKYGVEDPGA